MAKPILTGRCAVVTGAGKGLGAAYAKDLAAAGAAVVVNDIDLTSAAAVVNSITDQGGSAVVDGNSVTTWESSGAIVRTALTTFGRLDGLVNNAGVFYLADPSDEDPAMVEDMVRVNLLGTMHCGQHAIRHMAATRRRLHRKRHEWSAIGHAPPRHLRGHQGGDSLAHVLVGHGPRPDRASERTRSRPSPGRQWSTTERRSAKAAPTSHRSTSPPSSPFFSVTTQRRSPDRSSGSKDRTSHSSHGREHGEQPREPDLGPRLPAGGAATAAGGTPSRPDA